MMLSTKDLVFKEQPAKKLVDQYVGSYFIKEVVSPNHGAKQKMCRRCPAI